ncbi:MAG: cytochrome c3 family protein [Pseudomonadales bacterium]|nr:cytochrome c3 family protein [Pseudomonadales bacterium]MDP7594029.1 cytochrome c3 family protein [Pseudomonadales bacterium]HJN53334.1 cytochrome c3 family protein [Pseudomonadales bacterium]
MNEPTAWSHIKRMFSVIAAATIAFLLFVWLTAPPEWNYDLTFWHDRDALKRLAAQPMVYGGIESLSSSKRNISCKSCHEDVTKTVRRRKHKQVSCEACHGPLLDHVQDDAKVAAARIDESTWDCLNCHEPFINRPIEFPQFELTDNFNKHQEYEGGEFEPGTTCNKCHRAHDPTT